MVLVAVILGAGTVPRDPGTLVIGLGTDPGSLDPARVTSVADGHILRALFEGLTIADPETLAPLPGAAQSWSISPDGRTYRFELRPENRWSNGDALTSADFRASWLRLLDPAEGCSYASFLWSIVGAEAYTSGTGGRDGVAIHCPGPYSLEIVLKEPLPYFLCLTSFYSLSPVHPPSLVESGGSALTAPDALVSNGPYRLTGRWLRDRIRVEKSTTYWDAAHVEIPRIDFLAAESPTTLLNLFLTGEADWITKVPTGVIPALRSDPAYASVFAPRPHLETAFYRVNVTRPPWDDPALRRALSLALDREQLCERITRSGEQPAWSFVPWPAPALERLVPGGTPPLSDYIRACLSIDGVVADSHVTAEQWGALGFDPARAREVLIASGYQTVGNPQGTPLPPIEILYNTSPLHQRTAEWIQDSWARELGLTVHLRHTESKSAIDAQRSLDYDVARSSWVGDYLDPTTFLDVFRSDSGTNRTGWKDPEYDALLAAAARTPGGLIRSTIMFHAQRVLLERRPVIPL